MRDHIKDLAMGGFAIFTALLMLGLVLFAIRGCKNADPLPAIGIDAGPGDRAIAAELDAAVRREQERLDALIAEQQGELARLRGEDLAAFEAAKRRGRQALAEWFAARMPDGGRL